MAGSYIEMPLGMGGLIDPPRPRAEPGCLAPAACAAPPDPIGIRSAAPVALAPPAQGAPLRGQTQHAESVGAQWWEADLSDDPHPENPDWPRTLTITIGAAVFLLTENAVKHMAERMPAKQRKLEVGGHRRGGAGKGLLGHELTHVVQQGGAAAAGNAWPAKWEGPSLRADTQSVGQALSLDALDRASPSWAWAVTSGKSGVDFPLSSLAGALEKLAVRLPSKPKKHHMGMVVDEWEIGVTTEGDPWRVTHAVYKPASGG